VVATGITLAAAQSAQAAPAVPEFAVAPEGFAGFQGQSTCDPSEKPGVQDFRSLVLAAYPGTGDSGISRACNIGGASEHKEGRAWDWGVSAGTQGHIAGDLINWLLASRDGHQHALLRRFGIMYVIWNRQIFRAYRASEGWQPYTGENPHTDHVHFSFGWPGALRQTTWWTGRGDAGPDSVVWRQSNSTASSGESRFGWGGDRTRCAPITGDWDGNGTTTPGLACYTGTGWTWYRSNANGTSGSASFGWGGTARAFCYPITGDWDGNGTTTVGLACPETGGWTWYRTNTNGTSGSTSFGWGAVTSATTYPITGDWNGDGTTTVGLATLTSGGWNWRQTNFNAPSGESANFGWGSATLTNAIPISGDWDGNGTTTVGLSTHTSGGWIWRHTNSNASSGSWTYGWGGSTLAPQYHTPLTGDWNGDGTTSIAIVSAKRR
jgi:hypothetical protein